MSRSSLKKYRTTGGNLVAADGYLIVASLTAWSCIARTAG